MPPQKSCSGRSKSPSNRSMWILNLRRERKEQETDQQLNQQAVKRREGKKVSSPRDIVLPDA
jgi:hypothetical protein